MSATTGSPKFLDETGGTLEVLLHAPSAAEMCPNACCQELVAETSVGLVLAHQKLRRRSKSVSRSIPMAVPRARSEFATDVLYRSMKSDAFSMGDCATHDDVSYVSSSTADPIIKTSKRYCESTAAALFTTYVKELEAPPVTALSTALIAAEAAEFAADAASDALLADSGLDQILLGTETSRYFFRRINAELKLSGTSTIGTPLEEPPALVLQMPPRLVAELQELIKLGSRYVEQVVAVQSTPNGGILVASQFLEGATSVAEWSPQSDDEIAAMVRDALRGLRYCASHSIHHLSLRSSEIFRVDSDDVSSPMKSLSSSSFSSAHFVVTGFGTASLFAMCTASQLWDLGFRDVAMFPPELVRLEYPHAQPNRCDDGMPSSRADLSPEQMDLWALGCITFEKLFGCRLYECGDSDDGIALSKDELFEIVASKDSVPFPWSSGVKQSDGVRRPPDPRLVDIVHSLLSKKPEQRGSCDVWLRKLARFSIALSGSTFTRLGKPDAPHSPSTSSPAAQRRVSLSTAPIELPWMLPVNAMLLGPQLQQHFATGEATDSVGGNNSSTRSHLFIQRENSEHRTTTSSSVADLVCSLCGESDAKFFVCRECKDQLFVVCSACRDKDEVHHNPDHVLVPCIVEDIRVVAAVPTSSQKGKSCASLSRGAASSKSLFVSSSSQKLQPQKQESFFCGGSPQLPLDADDDFAVANLDDPRFDGSVVTQRRLLPMSFLSAREKSIFENTGSLPSGLLESERKAATAAVIHNRRMSLSVSVGTQSAQRSASAVPLQPPHDPAVVTSLIGAMEMVADDKCGRCDADLASDAHSGAAPPSHHEDALSNASLATCDAAVPRHHLIKDNEEEEIDLDELIEHCRTERGASLLLNDLELDHIPEVILMPLMFAHVSSLDLANNRIDVLPDSIEYLVNLRHLLLGNNRLKTLPDTIGNLTDLAQLDVNHNLLSDLPQSLMFCDQLETLGLDYNCLAEIPSVCWDLPHLSTLYINENAITSWPSKELLGNIVVELTLCIDNRPSLTADPPTHSLLRIAWNKTFPDKINENVYLGSLRTAQAPNVYEELNIQYVLTMGRGLDALPPPGGKHKIVIVDDLPGACIDFAFQEAVDFMEEAAESGSACLVHCFAGMSRSATAVIAYFMMKRGMRLDEAYCLTRKGRPAIYPNAGFFDQLITLDKKLYPDGRPLDMESMQRHLVP